MIRGIFFDLGWTLMKPSNIDWFIIDKLTEYVPVERLNAIPKARLQRAMKLGYDYLAPRHKLSTCAQELEQFLVYYGIFARELPELGLTQAQIQDIAWSKTYDMSQYVLFEDTLPTLQALRPGYRLGIISDTWPSVEMELKAVGIQDCFDSLTFSFEVGCFKPDPRMYRDALDKLGLPPEDTIFIDDTEINLDGAAALGIHPVLITAKPDGVNSGKYPTISCPGELPALLERRLW